MKIRKSFVLFGGLMALILGMSNSGLHPVTGNAGYTGAPGDSNCATCHSGGNANINGEISIDGLPTTIITGETYSLSISITNPNGNAVRAGFQMVALTGTNTNAGTMSNNSTDTQVRVVTGGKRYLGHAPATVFPAGNVITHFVDWTAPATTGSNPVIKFYGIAVIANGNGSSSLDRVALTNLEIPIQSGAAPLSVNISNPIPATCANSSNGSATATASGGTAPYNYFWSNGVNSAVNNSLPPGIAIVTVTDNAGVSATSSTNISSPPALNISAFGSVVCQGASNGSASAIASGGTGGFQYQWSNGSTGSNISNLTSGTYFVTVNDSNGCTASSFATVSTSPNINILANINNVTCNGLSNGRIITSVNGGTPGFTYVWSNGSTQPNIINITANTYTVTVTDAALCTSEKSFVVNEPPVLNAVVSNTTDVTCHGGNNGAATITASGGTPAYRYAWSNGATGTGASHVQTNLISGAYTVTVTDLLDCTKTVNFNIGQPPAIVITTVSKTDISCFGLQDGMISVAVSGNTGNVSYQWSNGATSQSISNLAAGSYGLTVTDSANGCTKSTSFVITQPTVLQAQVSSATNITCWNINNGTINTQVTGGTPTYTYLWSNGANTPNLNNLPNGIYTLTVTDTNGCTSSLAAEITRPEPMSVSDSIVKNATCLGASNGSLSVTVRNGILPYSFLWSNGATTATINNIPAGAYGITVTDGIGCTANEVFSVFTDETYSIQLFGKNDVSCYGDSTGMAEVTSDNRYTYLWSNGATTSKVENLQAGRYSVRATDDNQCQSLPLEVVIEQPLLLKAVLVEADSLLCMADTSGYLSVRLEGGTGSVNYNWSNGDVSLRPDSLLAGVYMITLTDANACVVEYKFRIYNADTIKIVTRQISPVLCYNESNGAISLSTEGGVGPLTYFWSNNATSDDTLTSLRAGTYTVTIRDSIMCSITDSFIVTQPDTLSAVLFVENESTSGMNDGKILCTPSGGTAPYAILWNNGATSFTLTDLAPGIYEYQITDDNLCTISGFTVVGGGNCALSVNYTVTHPVCANSNDGKISLTIMGQNGETDIQLYRNNVPVNYNLDSLPSGTYAIIITDASQCIAFLTNINLISEKPEILLQTLVVYKPGSPTSNDGSIVVSAGGGTGQLTFSWYKDGTLIPGESSASINNLNSGIYQFIITDEAGCNFISHLIPLEATNGLQPAEDFGLIIFPNPSFEDFAVISKSGSPITQLEIFDVTGHQIFKDVPVNQTASQYYSCSDTGISSSGLYIIKIWINGKPVIKKLRIIKQ